MTTLNLYNFSLKFPMEREARLRQKKWAPSPRTDNAKQDLQRLLAHREKVRQDQRAKQIKAWRSRMQEHKYTIPQLLASVAELKSQLHQGRSNPNSYISRLCRDVLDYCIFPYLVFLPPRLPTRLTSPLITPLDYPDSLEATQLVGNYLLINGYVMNLQGRGMGALWDPNVKPILDAEGKSVNCDNMLSYRSWYYPRETISLASGHLVVLEIYHQINNLVQVWPRGARYPSTTFSVPIDAIFLAGFQDQIIICSRQGFIDVYSINGQLQRQYQFDSARLTLQPLVERKSYIAPTTLQLRGCLVDGNGEFILYDENKIYLASRGQLLPCRGASLQRVFLHFTGQLIALDSANHQILRYGS